MCCTSWTRALHCAQIENTLHSPITGAVRSISFRAPKNLHLNQRQATLEFANEVGPQAERHNQMFVNRFGFRVCAGVASPIRIQAKTIHRSEEHTSELQSRPHLVCRLLL